jgi:hypothetical protein
VSDVGQFAMFLALGGGFIGMLFSPLGAAIARRLSPHGDEATDTRMAELEARIGELEGQLQGVQELSERMDFAERLLTQQRDAEPLPKSTAS